MGQFIRIGITLAVVASLQMAFTGTSQATIIDAVTAAGGAGQGSPDANLDDETAGGNVFQYPHPVATSGDLNLDGIVNSVDLDTVRGNWGRTVTPGDWSMGDASGDGVVGSADLDLVRANWGNTYVPDASVAPAVPEPSAIVVWSFLGLIGFSFIRRNK